MSPVVRTTSAGRRVQLWLVVENTSRKGFPQAFLSRLEHLAEDDPSFRAALRKADRSRLVIAPEAFRAIQCDIDVMDKTTVTLIARDVDSGKAVIPLSEVAERRAMKERRLRSVPTKGRDKARYDEILRYIYR